MNKLIFLACIVLFVTLTRHGLVQVNRFLDLRGPERETIAVTGKGVYYQPFRVDYLTGRSALLGRNVRVPVLSDRATSTTFGDALEIVVGRGLLFKRWVAPADKHLEYDNLMFKVLYLGAFVAIFAFFTFHYFRATRQLPSRKKVVIYTTLVAAGIIVFYII